MIAAGGAPLTEAQEGIWYAQALDPENPVFNTGQYTRIDGPLDVALFQDAVSRMIGEAEALSLRFSQGPEGVQQSVGAPPEPQYVDVSSAAEPEAEALAAIHAAEAQPANLARGPLACFTLYRLGPERFLWHQMAHHLALDGYGMILITRRVGDLYSAAVQGQKAPPALSPLARAVEEDAAYRDGDKRARDLAFWDAALADLPEVTGLAEGRAVSAHAFHRARLPLPDRLAQRLAQRAEAADLSWPDMAVALVGAYVRRFTGNSGEAVLGVPHMGRMGSKAARVPCTMVNVLPLRLRGDEGAPLEVFASEVAQDLRQTRRHGRFRSEVLRRRLGRIGGTRRLHGPLVNILPFEAAPAIAGCTARMEVTGAGSVDDITVTLRGLPEQGLTLEIDANPSLYTRAEVQGHADRLMAFLTAALAAESLSQVPLATPEEALAEVHGANATAHPVPETTLTALIAEGLARDPQALAVTSESESLTAADLDTRSAALAAELARRGAGPGRIVAVSLPRSAGLVVALLAVMRSGAAYLPVDPEDPESRKQAIFETAQPVALLAEEEGLLLTLRPSDWPTTGAAPEGPAPGDPAYVIFTSGSTGAPKGVVVEHSAIVNRLLWMRDQYGIGPADRILQKTPATFDVSVWEFFLPLICGARLAMAPPSAHRDPATIAGLIRAHGITTLHFVPSMLTLFLRAKESAGLPPLRLFTSGEALPAALRDAVHQRLTAQLHNLYGPTEAAVDVSFWDAGAGDDSQPVPIGHPVWNTRLYILDDHRRPLPQGLAGTLWIAGRQLARGYLNRDDLTQARFLPDPFVPGARMYDTGDRARRRADGAIDYLGRADDQLKIRGVRVEPGEVAAGLRRTGLVLDAAVTGREGRPGMLLVAHVVLCPGAGLEALREAAAGTLPAAMRPAAYVAMEALPLTANGKLDRRALPAPEIAVQQGRAPAPGAEAIVAQAMAEVLDLPAPPSAEAEFFALGGDSLSAVRLTLLLEERLGRDPGLGAVFEAPGVAALAQRLDRADHGLGPLIRLGSGALPPLYAVHPAGGLAWCYRDLARALPNRPVVGVQSPALDPGETLPGSLEALASGYLARILTQHPKGAPVHLLGWSLGGILAQELAVQVERAGLTLGALCLLDAYPAAAWRDDPEPNRSDALRALLALSGIDPEAYPELVEKAQILAFLRERGSPLGLLPPAVAEGVVRAVQGTNALVRRHEDRALKGPLLHVAAAREHTSGRLKPEMWRPLCGKLQTEALPLRHAQMTGAEASAQVAALLAPHLSGA
ncbi:non-ribosomal peptide synthetase [Pseudoroseicyclus aestuarii]|uniref:Enterobactin synthetase component F n=1 Tax=Pseudoroseicyclus aestuarii TaxID=1795041 RepID=A0A318SS07_9RHOB|nr:non-ribosomal peptide synthetase [Pseudoroseicyclus aestuarii]PYE84483.1 enterobactin synthetase component F [Pseudoroseicyclus aestuarii]